MARASYLQTSFLGGQWSATAQGRSDEDAYRTALNVCFNALPLEAGAVTRRPGTIDGGSTYHGEPAILRSFRLSQNLPFMLEFTDFRLRFWSGTSIVTYVPPIPLATVSSADPAVFGSAQPHGLNVSDQVVFEIVSNIGGNASPPADIAMLLNRQFDVTSVPDAYHFTLEDFIDSLIPNGAQINITGWNLTFSKVVTLATPYTFGEAWPTTQLRVVQDEDVAFVLVPGYPPWQLVNTGPDNAPVFAFNQPTFLDGPYLDPPTDGSTITPSAQSGTVTLTASAITSINNGAGFQSTDVGRFVRLFSEPLAWNPATAYTVGTAVKYQTGVGYAYYKAVAANTNVEPDTDDGTNWAISTSAAAWTWAIIQTVVDTSHVTAAIQGSATDVYQQPLAGGSLLYTNPVNVWQLGLWSTTTGWPEVGGFHEGRFYFCGPQQNRFDATMAQQDYNFAPTLLDGTVADNNGLSEIIKGEDRNTIFFVAPAAEGLILGTEGGEWLVQASQLNEPITPTSVQAHKVTKYGCANVEPRYTGLSWVFVQRYNRQIYEYLADVYSRKFQGTNIARRARSLTAPAPGVGVVELAYTQENAPVLWCRLSNNTLIGCTYKRESPFSTQPASFFGWHKHELGSSRPIESLQAGPSPDGTIDTVAMITHDDIGPGKNGRYVTFLTPVFEETDILPNAFYLDDGQKTGWADIETVAGKLSLVFYGIPYLNGETLTGWIGGTDAGDYAVAADPGTVVIPIDGSANPLLTQANLAALNGGTYNLIGAYVQVAPVGNGNFSPVGAVLDYTATGNAPLHHDFSMQDCFDWDANILYHQQTQQVGDPGTNGQSLFLFNIKTRAQIGSALDPGAGTIPGGAVSLAYSDAVCLGQDGNIYWGSSDGNSLVGRYNTTTFINDLFFNESPASLDAVGYISTIVNDGEIYAVITSLGSGNPPARVNVVKMTGLAKPTWCGDTFNVNEHPPNDPSTGNAYPFHGPNGKGHVVSWGYQYDVAHPGGQGDARVGLYQVAANGTTPGFGSGLIQIGFIDPTIVNAFAGTSWTFVTLPTGYGAIYDETDGNVILQISDGGSNTALVKLNSTTCAIMWFLALPGGQANAINQGTRVRGGRLSVVANTPGGGTYTLWEINTLTGVVSGSSPTETVLGPSNFATDDNIGIYCAYIGNIGTVNWATFGPSGGNPITPIESYNIPAALGFNYTSQFQLLRTEIPQETQDPTGPALGKSQRQHMWSAHFVNSVGTQVGTSFATGRMSAVPFLSPGRTQRLALNEMFTGIFQGTLKDDMWFDSMLGWQITRPYPTTIVSAQGIITTSPR